MKIKRRTINSINDDNKPGSFNNPIGKRKVGRPKVHKTPINYNPENETNKSTEEFKLTTNKKNAEEVKYQTEEIYFADVQNENSNSSSDIMIIEDKANNEPPKANQISARTGNLYEKPEESKLSASNYDLTLIAENLSLIAELHVKTRKIRALEEENKKLELERDFTKNMTRRIEVTNSCHRKDNKSNLKCKWCELPTNSTPTLMIKSTAYVCGIINEEQH